MDNHASREPLNFDLITDGIYVGNNQCCVIHFEELLQAEGITADISAEVERLDKVDGAELFVWIPVHDLAAPKQDQLEFAAKTITTLVALGKKTYIHCKEGHGRGPTFACAYLISKGMSAEAAIAYVQERRRGMHLEDSQREALEKFAERNI